MSPLGGNIPSMTAKSREYLFSQTVRATSERAVTARRKADRLACEAWNARMFGFQGPAQPSPAIGDALNAGYGYLEVKCLGCNTHQTVALDVVRRQKTTPVHELERYLRCTDCSKIRRYAYKRSQLIALRPNKITADSPASRMWPGDRD
jgi:phage FluMu protein Com